MADLPSPLRVIRPDDLLVLDVGLGNLALSHDGGWLVRLDPDAPAWIVLGLPPQHVAERAFMEFQDHVEQADPAPVAALSAGPSRLVFALRDGQQQVPFTVAGLLGWSDLDPRLAANAAPVGTPGGGGSAPAVPPPDVTAIEVPFRMIVSALPGARWRHRSGTFGPDGTAEVWHTRLVGSTGPLTPVRAVGVRQVPDVMRTSLALRDLSDVALLSADFSVRPRTAGELGISFLLWRLRLSAAGLIGHPFVPEPLQAERFVLGALGASVRMQGHFDFPSLDHDLDALAGLGLPTPSLVSYEHVVGQGRDQFVRVVRRGILCTGQRASLIKVTDRRYEGALLDRPGQGHATFGLNGYLRQYYQVVVDEPVIDFGALHAGYAHDGREMPLRTFRLTTLVTPKLDFPDAPKARPGDPGVPIDPDAIEARLRTAFRIVHRRRPTLAEEDQILADTQREVEDALQVPFWIKAGGTAVRFGFVATDWEHRQVSGQLPLVFVPLETVTDRANAYRAVAKTYNGEPDRPLRWADLQGQVLALADRTGASPHSTSAPADGLVFEVVPLANPAGVPRSYQATWLFGVRSAQVHLESVERLTGRPVARSVHLATSYLDHGMAPGGNPAGAYATLDAPVPLTLEGDRAGGVARPNSTLQVLSSRQGPIPATYANTGPVPRSALEAAFGTAKLFGTVTLTDLVKPIPLLTAEHFSYADRTEEELAVIVAGPEHLAVPVLRSRPLLRDGTVWAVETRYLWKPPLEVKDATVQPAFEVGDARLVLQGRYVTPVDGSPATAELHGELRDFAMSFFKVVAVHMDALIFRSLPGRKPDLTAEGVSMRFQGDLDFVNTLQRLLPATGFSDPPAVEITPSGVSVGFSLGVPTVTLGVFSLQNLTLGATLSLPFDERPAGLRFVLSERHHPFLVTVTLFGGGGFFALGVSAKGVEEIEASIEFGGNVALDIGVASGGVYVMAGVYFAKVGAVSKLTGYLRCGGYLCVLGIISISVEFYLSFTYLSTPGGSEVWGQASVTVSVKVCGISKSVSLSVEKRFAGSAADPPLDQVLSEDDWVDYCGAFAAEVAA